jgi:microcin C transport system permease protein
MTEKRQLLRLDPLTRKRVDRFKSIKRGYWSYLVMAGLILFSLTSELFINSRALVVVYQGKVSFPTYGRVRLGTEYGLDYRYETNYRDLKRRLAESGEGWVLLPPVPYNPYEQDFKEGKYPPYPPSFPERHIMGTDAIGRDIFARLVYGFRIAIFFAIFYVSITYFIGATVGCLMGYWGGPFDLVFQRIIEVWEQIPFLYVVMIVSSIFKPDFGVFLLIFIFFGWSARTWNVRAMTYRERERDYVLAARGMGASTWRIISVHIIPNVLVVIVTILPFSISGAISSLTALDYLGFGLRAPTPSWGELIGLGLAAYKQAPWILTSVVTAMTFVLVLIAFIGEGLREAFDPKKYTVYK